MRYEGVSFGLDWVTSLTEQEFVESPLNKHLWSQPGFAITVQQRKKRLRELWRLVNKQEVSNADDKQFVSGGRKG